MEDSTIMNSLLGTSYEKNNYYMSIYDINKNVIQKELISELSFSEEKVKNTNIIYSDIKNEAFCFKCKKNINLNMNPDCKTHNIKYLNDLIKDINIEQIEEDLELAIKYYENVYRIIEEKLNKFKKRNENQILLAKKIIELYKSNLNNLNYQMISNTKNLLHFNEIKLKDYEDYNSKFILETNILEEYSLNNYINETLNIQKIQKNTEIKIDPKSNIEKFIFLKKQNKIIFNTSQNIFLLNNKNYSIEDKIEIKDTILSLNLIEEEKILISFENSIKQLKIENDKIIIKEFLNNIEVSDPGIIIKYKDEYAWTNGEYIEFNHSKAYNYKRDLDSEDFDYKSSFYFKVINLIQFFDDILFIISIKEFYEGSEYYYFNLGSRKKGLSNENYISLENFNFDCDYDNNALKSYESLHKNYDISIFNYDEIIIEGKIGIYIINPYKWEIKKEIFFSNKLIQKVLYFNDSFFLIFLRKSLFKKNFHSIEPVEFLNINNENSNLVIAKIGGKYNKIIFETLINCEGNKIYYNLDINDGINNLGNKFISVQYNTISVYELINIQKKIEMKDN